MSCLAETSKTPIRTFFRFITVFYEHGCMRSATDDPDSDAVTVSQKCIDEVI